MASSALRRPPRIFMIQPFIFACVVSSLSFTQSIRTTRDAAKNVFIIGLQGPPQKLLKIVVSMKLRICNSRCITNRAKLIERFQTNLSQNQHHRMSFSTRFKRNMRKGLNIFLHKHYTDRARIGGRIVVTEVLFQLLGR